VSINVTAEAPVPLLVGAVVGALAAVLTGWVTVRSAGIFFHMLTLAIGGTLQHSSPFAPMTALETVVPAVQRHEKGRISVLPRAQVAVRERAEKLLADVGLAGPALDGVLDLLPAIVEQIGGVVATMRAEDVAVLLVEQDLHLAFSASGEIAVMEKGALCTGCRPARSAATRRPRDGCRGLPDEDVVAALRRRCTSSDGRIVKDGRPLAESLGPLSGLRHPGPDPGSRGSNVRAILVAAHSAPQGIRPPGPPRRPSGSVGRRA
jgi:hypothetical protein